MDITLQGSKNGDDLLLAEASANVAQQVNEDIRRNIAENIPVVAFPTHMLKFEDIEHHLQAPTRIKKRLSLSSLESLIDYVKSYATDRANVYLSKTVVSVILDDHTKNGPSHCEHVAMLHLRYHEDFERLVNASNNWLTQSEFADLISDLLRRVAEPDAMELLEIAQELRGATKVTWRSGKRLKDGRTSIEYVEEGDVGHPKGDVVVPDVIGFLLPIWDAEAEEQTTLVVKAELRYRVGQDGVKFKLIIRGINDTLRYALTSLKERISKSLPHPIYRVD